MCQSLLNIQRGFSTVFRLLSLGGGLLSRTLCLVNSSCLGLPILSTLYQLRESTVPHLDSPSLCMTGNSLKTLSWRHYAGAIRAHLMPFPSLKITILHCLMSGILKNHCFIYSNRRVNLIPVIPSQQEAEVPVCQVFSNYIHIANSKYQVSVLILFHISFWQADFSLTFCMKISGHMFIWFYLLLWPFLLSRLCWPAIHRLLAVKCLRV